jgi:hypothetical protein
MAGGLAMTESDAAEQLLLRAKMAIEASQELFESNQQIRQKLEETMQTCQSDAYARICRCVSGSMN